MERGTSCQKRNLQPLQLYVHSAMSLGPELDQNEDYRAWKVLDEVLRELEPRTLPKAVDLALNAIATPTGRAAPELPQVDDAPLSFARCDRG